MKKQLPFIIQLFALTFLLIKPGFTEAQDCPIEHRNGILTGNVVWDVNTSDFEGESQSFVACNDGILTSIIIEAATFDCSAGDLVIRIGTGNPIVGSTITTRTISFTCGGGGGAQELTFTLNPAVSLTKNETYFFTLEGLETGGGQFRNHFDLSGSYNSGHRYYHLPGVGWISFSGHDLNFKLTGSGTESPLPIELISFESKLIDAQVKLIWQTASEVDNKGFEIQRSRAMKTWETLYFVEGSGTSVVINSYKFIDERPLYGTNYYRLKQIDFDGSYEYSDALSVDFNNRDIKPFQLYPNPVTNGELILSFHKDFNETSTFALYSPTGQLILKRKTINPKETVDVKGLNTGIYRLELTNGHEVWQELIVIQ